MPVMVSYNFEDASSSHNSRMQCMFERFGWQNVGGSCYRYPPLSNETSGLEDWLNYVIPALMLFRSYIASQNLTLSRFSLDVHASTGVIAGDLIGKEPYSGDEIPLANPSHPSHFGEGHLRRWLDQLVPYEHGWKADED